MNFAKVLNFGKVKTFEYLYDNLGSMRSPLLHHFIQNDTGGHGHIEGIKITRHGYPEGLVANF